MSEWAGCILDNAMFDMNLPLAQGLVLSLLNIWVIDSVFQAGSRAR